MIAQIAAITLPVFVLAAIGFIWVKRGFEYDFAFITRLVLQVGTPCLVFSTLVKTEIDAGAFQAIALAAVSLYAGLGVLAFILLRLLSLPLQTWLSPFVFSNSGNVGLPLCLFAYGEEGLAYGIAIFSTMVVCNFTVGVWIVSGKPAPWEAFRQPMVYGALIGALFLSKGWEVPVWALNTFTLAGQFVIPLMLITLGASIAGLPRQAPWGVIGLSLTKYALSGAVAFGAASVFGLTGAAFGVFLLQALTPVPVTSYLLAQRFDAGAADVARFVMISTLLAVPLIPVVLRFLLGE
jgi:predicted permease